MYLPRASGLVFSFLIVLFGSNVQADSPRAKSPPARAPDLKAATDLWGEPLPLGALTRMRAASIRDIRHIQCAALSPDGKVVALATDKDQIYLMDALTGKPFRQFRIEPLGLPFLAFPPDDTNLTWINKSGALILWDAVQSKELRRFAADSRRIVRFDFAAKGKLVTAVAEAIGEDPLVYAWEIDTGKERARLGVLQNWQVNAALSAGGGTLATWGQQVRRGERAQNQLLSRTIQIRDLASGQELGQFLVKGGPPAAVALSAGGKKLAAVGSDSMIHLWQISPVKELRQITGFDDLAFLSFSPDETTLLAATSQGAVIAFDTTTGKKLFRCEGPGGPISSLFFSAGKGLALGIHGKNLGPFSERQTPYVWEVPSAKAMALGSGHHGPIHSLAFLPGGKELASAGTEDGQVLIWETTTGRNLRQIHPEDQRQIMSHGLGFSPDGRLLARAGNRTGYSLVELATGGKARELEGEGSNLGRMAFSADGSRIVSTGWNSDIPIWDARTGRRILEIKQNQKRGVNPDGPATALSPDGNILAVAICDYQRINQGSHASEIRLWEVASGNQIRAIQKFFSSNSIAFSPNGTVLAWVGHHASFLLDPATGKDLRRFETAIITSLPSFSPDGRTLAVASRNREADEVLVQLWEVASGLVRTEWKGFTQAAARPPGADLRNNRLPMVPGQDLPTVTSLAFSHDGKMLATGCSDGTILVWSLAAFFSGPEEKQHLSAAEAEDLWSELAVRDAQRGYRAIRRLEAASTDAVRLFEKHLPNRTSRSTDEKGIQKLIADLDHDDFSVREESSHKLRRLGQQARPALVLALEKKPSPEMHRRVEQLLDKLGEPDPPEEMLRSLRMLEVLEHTGSPLAKQLVETLAEGQSYDWLSREAKVILSRWTGP